MQWIDQNVVGAVDGTEDRREIRKVAEIPHTPGPTRPDRVQLREHTPAPAVAQCVRSGQPRRCHHERARRGGARGGRLDRVPPARNVGGHGERRAPHENTVDLSRIDPHLELACRDRRARLRVDRDVHRLAVRNVDHETGLGSVPADDDGRQHPPPRRQFALGQGAPHLVLRCGGNVERCEDAAERVVAHVVTPLVPTLIRRRNPVPGREITQLLGVRHPSIVPVRLGFRASSGSPPRPSDPPA